MHTNMQRTQSMDSLPELHLALHAAALSRVASSSAFDTSQPITPEASAETHPWAATGGLPPAPKRQRTDTRRRRPFDLASESNAAPSDVDDSASNSHYNLRRPHYQRSCSVSSSMAARNLLPMPPAPRFDQGSRFGSLPLASPAESAFGMHLLPGQPAEDADELDLQLRPGEHGPDPESKSRAWLAQCSAALDTAVQTPPCSQPQTQTQQTQGLGEWAAPLLPPWTPESRHRSSLSPVASFNGPHGLMTPPTSVERPSIAQSPASCTRSKAKRAAAAAQAVRDMRLLPSDVHLPPVLALARSTTTNRMQSVDSDAMSMTSDGDQSSTASSLFEVAVRTKHAERAAAPSASRSGRPGLPWQLRSKSNSTMRNSPIAQPQNDRIRHALHRRATSSGLSPYLNSPLAFNPVPTNGLGINLAAGSPSLLRPETRSSGSKYAHGAGAPYGDAAAKRSRAHSTALSADAGILDLANGGIAMSRSASSSSSHSRRSMSASLSRSSSRLGTPFSAGGASCGASSMGVAIAAGHHRSATPDYFGDAWRTTAPRRVC